VSKNKNISIYFFVYHKIKNTDNISIGIKALEGQEKLGRKSTKQIIPERAWNKKRRKIRSSYLKECKSEADRLDELEVRMKYARNMMADNLWIWQTAKDYIFQKSEEFKDESVLEFTKQIDYKTFDREYKTLVKWIETAGAFENALPKELKPLMFSHFIDKTHCQKIERFVLNNDSWSNSYKKIILQTIQNIWRYKHDYKWGKGATEFIFHNIPSDNKSPTPKKPVDTDMFMEGLNGINTFKQFEALLFWLYSFCLLGLDGVDIINIDEKKIVEENYNLDYYHPDLNMAFPDKIHIEIRRSKTQEDGYSMVRLINLFPILYIKRLLEYCIKINHPKLAYKGDDKLKLFNFYTRDEKGKQIPDGVDKWDFQRKYYGKLLKKKIKATIQHTRSTSANASYRSGLDKVSIDANLGHSKSLKHYLSEWSDKVDTDHIYTLVEYDIMDKINALLRTFANRKEIINNKEIDYIPFELLPLRYIPEIDERRKKDRSKLSGNLILTSVPLTRWSREKEMTYQKLLSEVKNGTWMFDEESQKNIKIKLHKTDYPEELKELQKEKDEIFAKEMGLDEAPPTPDELIPTEFENLGI